MTKGKGTPKTQPASIKDILARYLIANGWHGFIDENTECICSLSEGNINSECESASENCMPAIWEDCDCPTCKDRQHLVRI